MAPELIGILGIVALLVLIAIGVRILLQHLIGSA